MEVSAGKIRGQYRAADKDAWQTLGQSDIPAKGEPRIGLITGYAAKNVEHFTRFSGFRISKLTDVKTSRHIDVDVGGGVKVCAGSVLRNWSPVDREDVVGFWLCLRFPLRTPFIMVIVIERDLADERTRNIRRNLVLRKQDDNSKQNCCPNH